MGRHFTLGEASPPLGAFDAFFRWFPALKRRAGLTSPPLGAFANDDQGDHQEGLRPSTAGFKFILKNAVENHFTAKPPRAQRTYSKDRVHWFSEAIERLNFESNPCFSWRLCAFAGEV